MHTCMYACRCVLRYACMDGWLAGRQAGWMDGWVGGRVGGWMDGWMDEIPQPIQVAMYTHA